ncbi:MAG: hypothetical protein HYZ81_01605 [Nitrospinae bacterium]|nr:hypothetical protein [Nitrospinota bacterium]
MMVFHEGRLTDRRTPRSDVKAPSRKDTDPTDLPTGSPEEFHQTQALMHDLDQQFNGLRETLRQRRGRIAQLKSTLSELSTLLIPSRRRWWRRWFPK